MKKKKYIYIYIYVLCTYIPLWWLEWMMVDGLSSLCHIYTYIYTANRERTVVIEKVSVLNDNDIDETFVGKRKILASAICL